MDGPKAADSRVTIALVSIPVGHRPRGFRPELLYDRKEGQALKGCSCSEAIAHSRKYHGVDVRCDECNATVSAKPKSKGKAKRRHDQVTLNPLGLLRECRLISRWDSVAKARGGSVAPGWDGNTGGSYPAPSDPEHPDNPELCKGRELRTKLEAIRSKLPVKHIVICVLDWLVLYAEGLSTVTERAYDDTDLAVRLGREIADPDQRATYDPPRPDMEGIESARQLQLIAGWKIRQAAGMGTLARMGGRALDLSCKAWVAFDTVSKR